MISVRNLTKRFGRLEAVSDLSFDVNQGESVALWGPNGAGKTTVIRCLLGLLRHDGTITVAGHDTARAGKAARTCIGYVPQELAFYDDFRLHEALAFFGRLRRVAPERSDVVLAESGLLEHRAKRVRELSGGMKQRLALALALLSDPPLLVLDELTSNLDVAAQAGFMSLLHAQKHAGKTILFTSHRHEEVEKLSDRVLILEAGRLVLECSPQEVPGAAERRCVLKVYVAEEVVPAAIDILRGGGFRASRNGRGVVVEVPAVEKAAPLRALMTANIHVRDFDLSEGQRGGEVDHD